MKSIFWLLTLAVSALASCASESSVSFLLPEEVPIFNTIINDVDGAKDITLEITNKSGVVKSLNVGGNPSELTEVHESFYTDFCDERVLVVVVRQYITGIESYGWVIYNVVIRSKDGSLLKVIETGLFSDNKTETVSYDSQTKVLSSLKSGEPIEAACTSTEQYISPL